jgi:LysM repeat protein
MTVCRIFAFATTLLFLLVGAGCRDHGKDPIQAETDDAFFVQGKQLQRQGRNPEALTAYLKVIEKRGERGAAESHLECGQIYLNHTKDPVEAYHHFRKYLELQPNSRQAEFVRGMVKAALREFARTIPGRIDDQSLRPQGDEEAQKLRREVDELRAELAVLRGGGGVPVNRAPHVIKVPVDPRATALPVPTTQVVQSPITAAPSRGSNPAPVAEKATASRIGPESATRTPTPSSVRTPVANTTRPPATPASRPPVPTTGRTHTVVAKDTLFSLSKKYGVKMEDLAAANGLPSVAAPLKLGTVLKIPGPTAVR